MKAVIFAGGHGTRISEESSIRPKPMIEIGNKPILWHILKMYSHFGINEFIICAGYKSYVIKEYFSNYFLHECDVSFDLGKNKIDFLNHHKEPWKVTVIDTGQDTMTGGRLKKIKEHIGNETFCLTYGDGLSDVNIAELVSFHHEHGGMATLTAVRPPSRFGAFTLVDGQMKIDNFKEKALISDTDWINGGFFVCEPSVLELIRDDDTIWEKEPLETLASNGNLIAYRHTGFWQPMDTLRDKCLLEDIWKSGNIPWKHW